LTQAPPQKRRAKKLLRKKKNESWAMPCRSGARLTAEAIRA
jgi:hypothetical protein